MKAGSKFEKISLLKFNEENSQEIPLWRYMNITKFIDMLFTKSIYIPRADTFEDPYEGCFPEHDYNETIRLISANPEAPDYVKANIPAVLNDFRYSYVSCWHSNQKESEAMWKLYSQERQSVAIETTSNDLIKSMLTGLSRNQKIGGRAGLVDYIDYDDVTQTVADPIFAKRTSYSHENEFRIALHQPFSPPESSQKGISIACNMEQMIKKIHISPWADALYQKAIEHICLSMLPMIRPVKSTLNEKPHWQ